MQMLGNDIVAGWASSLLTFRWWGVVGDVWAMGRRSLVDEGCATAFYMYKQIKTILKNTGNLAVMQLRGSSQGRIVQNAGRQGKEW